MRAKISFYVDYELPLIGDVEVINLDPMKDFRLTAKEWKKLSHDEQLKMCETFVSQHASLKVKTKYEDNEQKDESPQDSPEIFDDVSTLESVLNKHEEQHIHEKVWLEAWTSALNNQHVSSVTTADRWADACLSSFVERFRPNREERLSA